MKKKLIEFEKKIKVLYEKKIIKSPIHLSGNNENELIKIFKNIKKNDWVFSTWRNHYHALLHGITEIELLNQIIGGRSMSICSAKPKFYSSSIVGGILPIAVGVALSHKIKNIKNNVWVFIGDMTYETGVFHECHKYSIQNKLKIKFIVEDNNMSTNTPTNKVWKKNTQKMKNVIKYKYTRKYPHHGTGNWVLF
jgi:TPP-dependent pyruvate/acetoin dehydrogenase alpha subunit